MYHLRKQVLRRGSEVWVRGFHVKNRPGFFEKNASGGITEGYNDGAI